MALHRLERRADMLAQKMRDSTNIFAQQMGEGQQPPFTTALTNREALDWWRLHRHDQYGAAVLQRFTPQQILDLDTSLMRQTNPEEPALGGAQPFAGMLQSDTGTPASGGTPAPLGQVA